MLVISVIFICLILNSILACTEIAFVSVPKSTLHALSKEGNRKAKLLLTMLEQPEKILSVIQIGITFVSMLGAAFGGTIAEEAIVPWLIQTLGIGQTFATILSVFIIVIPLTYLNVVIGELVPKMLGLKRSIFFALAAVSWLRVLSALLYPLIKILEWSTKNVVKLFMRIFKVKKTTIVSKESVLLEELSSRGRRYVLNIVDLERKTLQDALIPWEQVTHLDKNQSIEEVENIVISSGHTRLPVVEGEEVIGILHSKEFMAYKKGDPTKKWHSILRKPMVFPENTSLMSALLLMQKKCFHMAIVFQKKKKIGILTLEDILEEIVGEIYDEDDEGSLLRLLKKSR